MNLPLRMLKPILLLAIAVSLCSCASAPTRPPVAEAKLTEAAVSLDAVNEETQQFFRDVEAVRRDVHDLYAQPGWAEMRVIIEALPEGTQDPAASKAAEQKTRAWSRKWKEPWEGVFARYLTLVKRSSALEAKRLMLQSRLLGVEAKYLGAAAQEFSAGHYDQGQSMYDVADLLSRSAEELDAALINAIGVYE